MEMIILCFLTIPDKCLIENGGCEHLCEKGGKCSCLTGYQLVDDDKHCEGAHMCVWYTVGAGMGGFLHDISQIVTITNRAFLYLSSVPVPSYDWVPRVVASWLRASPGYIILRNQLYTLCVCTCVLAMQTVGGIFCVFLITYVHLQAAPHC